MYCKNCGKAIHSGSAFCPYCGVHISNGSNSGSGYSSYGYSMPNASNTRHSGSADPRAHQRTAKKRGLWWLIPAAILVVLILIVGTSSVSDHRPSNSNVSSLDASQQINTVNSENKSENHTVVIEPGTATDAQEELINQINDHMFGDEYEGDDGYVVEPDLHMDDAYSDTFIPSALIMRGNGYPEEYAPMVWFYDDGSCTVRVNTGEGCYDLDGAFEVYEYSTGGRVIQCDLGATDIGETTPRISQVFFLREVSEAQWELIGEYLGQAASGITSLQPLDSDILSVSSTYVDTDEYMDYASVWQGYEGMDIPEFELNIYKINGGLICFNMAQYRTYSFNNQTAIICPDGNAYAFIYDEYQEQRDCAFVRITFSNNGISMRILSVKPDSLLTDVVGQSIYYGTRSSSAVLS